MPAVGGVEVEPPAADVFGHGWKMYFQDARRFLKTIKLSAKKY
jgi:hypothetical protein